MNTALLLAALAAPIAAAEPAQSHWAFRPVVRPDPPKVAQSEWPRNPIDRFILARLESAELAPAREADRATLLRRLKVDLLGLPPTPEEVAAFVADVRPDAYERLVDRLLASPHHGERWARHWLDVVRFAESDGFEMNQARPNAWPYRDYVIRALNEDRSYDRFVTEQVAGDVLGVDVATSFLVGGPFDKVKSPDVALTLQQRADELHDILGTTASTFLGLTVGCARRHDHKFDPISQLDYYGFKAVFAGVQHGERAIRPADIDQRQQAVAALDRDLAALGRRAAQGPRPSSLGDAVRRALALSGQVKELQDRRRSLLALPMSYAGRFTAAEATHRLHRGDPLQQREPVAPAALTEFGGKLRLPADTPEQQRRLVLAKWITDPSHPLTARVLVNRLWQHHFGAGLVGTPSDFGRNGDRPSHPDLLDWLASEFVAGGWEVKRMHRLIVLSSTYRQTGTANPQGLAADAAARLLWRYPPRRLEAEPLRDALLFVSGRLDPRMGGPGFDLFEPNSNYVKVYNPKKEFGPAEWRRMIYQNKPRMQLDDTFGSFDCPDAGQIAPRRTTSTTALQALNLLNSRFLVQQAGLFADRLRRETGDDPDAQVRRGFRLAFQREPAAEEHAAAVRLVRDHGLAAFGRALFNANEFLYVD